jgi:hypothetical protein
VLPQPAVLRHCTTFLLQLQVEPPAVLLYLPQAPTCKDKKRNGAESDVDCGGSECPTCKAGKNCARSGDCRSNNCVAGKCVAKVRCLCSQAGTACKLLSWHQAWCSGYQQLAGIIAASVCFCVPLHTVASYQWPAGDRQLHLLYVPPCC